MFQLPSFNVYWLQATHAAKYAGTPSECEGDHVQEFGDLDGATLLSAASATQIVLPAME
jgi:hypothetical protein